MTQLMKIPIILWGDQPPSHQITCIAVCQSGVIVTGSIEGQLVFWTINYNEFKILPQSMIIAHSSSVESLVGVHNEKLEISSGVVSLADNQELCLWNSETSCCLSNTFLHGRFHTLKTLPCLSSVTIKECLLACFGYQNTIQILDPFSLQSIFILKPDVHKCCIGTIRSLSYAFSSDKNTDDILMAVTHDGSLISWPIPCKFDATKNGGPVAIYGKRKYFVDKKEKFIPCCVCVEPELSQFILLCESYTINLFTFPDFKLVMNVSTGDYIVSNAMILSPTNFIIFFENGPPLYYYIDPGNGFSITKKFYFAAKNSEIPTIECACFFRNTSKCAETIVCGVSATGNLIIWKVDMLKDVAPSDFKRLAIASTSLAEVWKSAKPRGIGSSLAKSLSMDDVNVSCSFQLQEYGFMIFGLRNGSIVIASTIELLLNQMLEDSSVKNVSNLVLSGHVGAVKCLCHPFDECNKHNPCHLLSGGVDFSIRLWNIVSGTQLKVYYPHGGFIQDIFVVTGPEINSTNLNIISVASDYSVSLINLTHEKEILTTRCHTSPVYSVKWRINEDLLLVYCSDGTLFVWQITTGNLERCITGKSAIEIFESCEEDTLVSCESQMNSSFIIVNMDQEAPQKHHRHSFLRDIKTKRGFMGSGSHNAHVLSSKKKILQKVFRKISVKHRHSRPDDTSNDVPKTSTSHLANICTSNNPATQPSNLTCHPSHHSSACNLASAHSEITHSNFSSHSVVPPFDVISIRTGHHDSDFHVFLVDFDNIVSQLLCEEEKTNITNIILQNHGLINKSSIFSASSSSSFNIYPNQSSTTAALVNPSEPSLSLVILTLGLCPTSDSKIYKKYCHSIQNYRSYILLSTAKFLISCLHPWGLDRDIDQVCSVNLQLSPPIYGVSYGFMSRHKLQLTIPGWSTSTFLSKPELIETPIQPIKNCMDKELTIKHITHWQISSIITSQHFVALTALTNTVGKLYILDHWVEPSHVDSERQNNNLKFPQTVVSHKCSSGRQFITTSVPDLSLHKPIWEIDTKKDSWKMLSNQHSNLLSVFIKEQISYLSPFIHELILYWLDSYDDIRQASYDLLLSHLNQMSKISRQNLVKSWCIYLPTNEQIENLKLNQFLVLSIDDYIESGGFYGFWPSDQRYQRTLAIFLISFIISEYPNEFDPLVCEKPRKNSPAAIDVSVIITLANTMFKVLKAAINLKKNTQYSIRKAFLFFIGRSFGLWQPHLNISQLIMCILDSIATLDFYLQYLDTTNKKKSHQHSTCNELLINYRNCLQNIMLSHPEVIITVLNKEVSRFSSTSTYVSMGQSAIVAAATYSNMRHQNPLTAHPTMLQLARNEIINLISLMSEKSPERLLTLILETVDLLLNCSAHKILKKENHVLTTFPFLTKYNMIDYCSINRRLAVGTTKGQFAIFDIRSLRCTLLQSFNGPITCLKFSADGRQLVAYCYDEMKICIWNTHFSIFGLLSSTPKAGVCFHLKQQKKVNSNQISKIHLIWKNTNSFKLVFNENYELSFTV